MKEIPNPQLRAELIQRARDLYLTRKPQMGKPHISELIYCLTKGYWDLTDPISPTDHEVLLFSIGFGLERVMLRGIGNAEPQTVERDGMLLTPDYVTASGGMVDLKTTRAPMTKDGKPLYGWPEGWMQQIMAYAHAFGLEMYSIAPLFLKEAELPAVTFVFEDDEVEDNWRYLLQRKAIYLAFQHKGMVPTPFSYNMDFECRFCRYQMRCNALKGAK